MDDAIHETFRQFAFQTDEIDGDIWVIDLGTAVRLAKQMVQLTIDWNQQEPFVLVGGQQIFAHPVRFCAGPACPLHRPSDHHMRLWRQNWRDDSGKMERLCSHGVGHPDPDDSYYQRFDGAGIHACCVKRCCMPPQEEEIVE